MSSSDTKTPPDAHDEEEMEEYQGGLIQAHHGGIHLWLMAVYFILFIWGLIYLYQYWGGLGPGLDYAS